MGDGLDSAFVATFSGAYKVTEERLAENTRPRLGLNDPLVGEYPRGACWSRRALLGLGIIAKLVYLTGDA